MWQIYSRKCGKSIPENMANLFPKMWRIYSRKCGFGIFIEVLLKVYKT